MGVLDQERFDRILQILKWNPRGITISDVSSKMKMNRNLVSKYLDMLLVSGQVEVTTIGNAKVYSLAHRIPISAMLEFSSDVVIVLDGEHRIRRVNEPALKFLNEGRDAVIGTDIDETCNPFLKELKEHLITRTSHDPGGQITEMSSILQDEDHHFRVKQIPTVFEDGSKGITLIIEDITEEAAYQENLRMSEARYRGIVEDQTEFIVRFLPDNTITFANEAYARYLETKREDMIGSFPLPNIHRDDTPILERALRIPNPGRPVTTFECRVTNQAGQTRWNVWTIRAFYDDHANLLEFQGVGRDNTEKREAAAKIKKYIKGMEYLAQTGIALRDMGEDDDIYEYVAQQVYALAPGFLVWVGILDETGQNLVIRSVAGNPIALDTVHQLTGMKVGDMTFPIKTAETADLIQHRRLVKTPPLFRLLHMQVPEEICRQIEEAAWGIDSYLMGLVSKGRIVGDVGISIQGGAELKNRDIIEAFIRQAAIAIDRKIADDGLRQSLAREQEQVKNLRFLSQTAMDFIEMEESADIYQYIGERIHQLIPESIIGINSFDAEHQEITLRAVAGDREQVQMIWDILGMKLLGSPSFIDEKSKPAIDFSKNTIFEVRSSSHLFFHEIPEERYLEAERRLKLGKCFGLGFSCKGGIFGNILIVLTRPGEITNREIIEAFVNQASQALLQRHARDQQRESEERFRLLAEQNPYPLVILGLDGRILAANGLAAALLGCCDASGVAGKSFGEFLENSRGPLPGLLLQDRMSVNGNDLSCRLMLRSPGTGVCEVEVWGKMVQYGKKPAIFMTLRPLP